jgi:hypothetical protein
MLQNFLGIAGPKFSQSRAPHSLCPAFSPTSLFSSHCTPHLPLFSPLFIPITVDVVMLGHRCLSPGLTSHYFRPPPAIFPSFHPHRRRCLGHHCLSPRLASHYFLPPARLTSLYLPLFSSPSQLMSSCSDTAACHLRLHAQQKGYISLRLPVAAPVPFP